MDSSAPVTPASPKLIKVKDPQPGVPLFGCGKSSPIPIYIPNFVSLVQCPNRRDEHRASPAAPELRACGPHEEHYYPLQELLAGDLRQHPYRATDLQDSQESTLHCPHAELSLPAMHHHYDRTRPHYTWDGDPAQILYGSF